MAHNLRGLLVPVKSLLGVILPLRMEAAGCPVALTGVIFNSSSITIDRGGAGPRRHSLGRNDHDFTTCLEHALAEIV